MSNQIIRAEFSGELLGVKGRFHNLIADPETGAIRNQKFNSERRKLNKAGDQITAQIRFDDELKNGHSYFSITATIYDKHGRDIGGGCCHDDIAKAFPEFRPLIKWHLVSTDGPMHYLANVVYLAGDRDCSGRRAGEPESFDTVVRFGNSPLSHAIGSRFWHWLAKATTEDTEWIVDKIEHGPTTSNYEYGPKFTFAGFADKWHECPFDSLAEANEWLEAITTCEIVFDKLPTSFSKGKARELDAARRVALWPEATDEQLSADPEELKAKLLERLPALLAEFKQLMLDCGFIWEL